MASGNQAPTGEAKPIQHRLVHVYPQALLKRKCQAWNPVIELDRFDVEVGFYEEAREGQHLDTERFATESVACPEL
ncbi:hypothetical protein I6F26_17935 [Ensifer sp. IC3342]|nr:hypothetical protein [Ensifer sp. BRP08]MCA1448461.1 hypothetical protein [Ensifer sp. IC3342]